MTIGYFLLIVVVIGVVVGLIQRSKLIDPRFKAIAFWGAIIFLVILLLDVTGLLTIISRPLNTSINVGS